ncbi:2-hydroxy-3-oxopropionate reductase [Arthrobacter sp. MPF02]|uniref:2-hydroxy-3-oxopropionate reductase n=1 Tax=Arthrobacter sp. MPF02 TaxID=3388492 RepID=UPI0039846431
MKSIAFIGLGIMGRPMATNLAQAGYEVRGYARSESTRERAGQAGVPVAASVAAAVEGADIVITMLPDTPDVLGVCEGPDGLLQVLTPGTVFVDMSTIEPAASQDLADRFAERGIDVLDAPVSGGEQAAIEGILSVMVGGNEDVLERVRPLLETVGKTVVHVGPAGSGQVTKAANQLMVALHLQALSEATLFLERSGVAVDKALQVIAGGLAGSTVLERKKTSVLTRSYAPGFRLELHHKDLGIVQKSARDLGVALPGTALVSSLVQSLVARGDGGLDHSALFKLTTELNQVGAPARANAHSTGELS